MSDPNIPYVMGELMGLKIAVRALVHASPDKAGLLALLGERLEQSIAQLSETSMPDDAIAGLRATLELLCAPSPK